MGEETGGRIVSYGDKIMTELPITRMPLSISTKKFYTIGANDKDMHGIVPNIKVESDKSLDFVIDKIREDLKYNK